MNNENQELGMEGPGVSTGNIGELDAAIKTYLPIKTTRVEYTNKETEAKKKVIDLLHKHKEAIGVDANGTLRYRCGDYVATLAPSDEKLTIKEEHDKEE